VSVSLLWVVDDGEPVDPRYRREHGLAVWMSTPCGEVLLDTGGSGEVLMHNLEVAGKDPADLAALALSHAHDDHTGGLQALLEHSGRIPLYANPDLFRRRFSDSSGTMKSRGLPLGQAELEQMADLRLGAAPQQILPGVWTTGVIGERISPEGGSRHHWVPDDGGYAPDGYADDMSLVIQGFEGWVAVCGCCHAGLIDTLRHVRAAFSGPMVAVAGGLHLEHWSEELIHETIAQLRELGPLRMYLSHCTGERAVAMLQEAFGERVVLCSPGMQVVV